MPRPVYQVTAEDLEHAERYLRRTNLLSHDEVATLLNCKPTAKAAERLQAWAEKNLDEEEWQRLKTAIRQRRRRHWKKGVHEKTITIKVVAYEKLRRVAKRDGRTLSETIEFYLGQALRRAPARNR